MQPALPYKVDLANPATLVRNPLFTERSLNPLHPLRQSFHWIKNPSQLHAVRLRNEALAFLRHVITFTYEMKMLLHVDFDVAAKQNEPAWNALAPPARPGDHLDFPKYLGALGLYARSFAREMDDQAVDVVEGVFGDNSGAAFAKLYQLHDPARDKWSKSDYFTLCLRKVYQFVKTDLEHFGLDGVNLARDRFWEAAIKLKEEGWSTKSVARLRRDWVKVTHSGYTLEAASTSLTGPIKGNLDGEDKVIEYGRRPRAWCTILGASVQRILVDKELIRGPYSGLVSFSAFTPVPRALFLCILLWAVYGQD